MREAYEASCREHGHEPGMTQLPPNDAPTTMFVADDVDKAWDEIGEYILHDVKMYGEWNPGDETTASISHAQTVDELRATSPAHKIYSTDEAAEMVRTAAAAHADAALRWHPAGDRVAVPGARGQRRAAARRGEAVASIARFADTPTDALIDALRADGAVLVDRSSRTRPSPPSTPRSTTRSPPPSPGCAPSTR